MMNVLTSTSSVNSICLEWLNIEMVRYFQERYGDDASDKVELIGYHVGYRLTER
jgi:uncharacterized protein YjaZ